MRGRKPDPLPVQLFKGARPSRLHREQPLPRVAEPAAPRGLPVAVRVEFRRIVTELRAMGAAYAADALVIEVLARAVVRQREAAAVLAREGYVLTGARGGWVTHPMARVERDAAATVLRACAELGLTPSARSRVRLSPPAADDDLEGLLS